jgi:hypothetical protein
MEPTFFSARFFSASLSSHNTKANILGIPDGFLVSTLWLIPWKCSSLYDFKLARRGLTCTSWQLSIPFPILRVAACNITAGRLQLDKPSNHGFPSTIIQVVRPTQSNDPWFSEYQVIRSAVAVHAAIQPVVEAIIKRDLSFRQDTSGSAKPTHIPSDRCGQLASMRTRFRDIYYAYVRKAASAVI